MSEKWRFRKPMIIFWLIAAAGLALLVLSAVKGW